MAATWATGHPRICQRHSRQVVNDSKTRTNRSHLLICPSFCPLDFVLLALFLSCFIFFAFLFFFIIKKYSKIIVGTQQNKKRFIRLISRWCRVTLEKVKMIIIHTYTCTSCSHIYSRVSQELWDTFAYMGKKSMQKYLWSCDLCVHYC